MSSKSWWWEMLAVGDEDDIRLTGGPRLQDRGHTHIYIYINICPLFWEFLTPSPLSAFICFSQTPGRLTYFHFHVPSLGRFHTENVDVRIGPTPFPYFCLLFGNATPRAPLHRYSNELQQSYV